MPGVMQISAISFTIRVKHDSVTGCVPVFFILHIDSHVTLYFIVDNERGE